MLTSLNTTVEVQRHKTRMAILPVGATEQHSAHLPLATDTIIVEAVAQGVAKKLDAYCLPALPFSISHMHRGCRGTVWLRNQTITAVIRDIATSLLHEGFSQFVLINGHGGNFILVPIVQDLNLDFPQLLTMTLDSWTPVAGRGIFAHPDPLMHADEFETSCMLHLRADAVRRNKLRDNPEQIDRELLRYFPIGKLAARTHAGHPTRARAEDGRRAVDCMIEEAARSIETTIKKVNRIKAGIG
jgi:creatinine amidohydrolase